MVNVFASSPCTWAPGTLKDIVPSFLLRPSLGLIKHFALQSAHMAPFPPPFVGGHGRIHFLLGRNQQHEEQRSSLWDQKRKPSVEMPTFGNTEQQSRAAVTRPRGPARHRAFDGPDPFSAPVHLTHGHWTSVHLSSQGPELRCDPPQGHCFHSLVINKDAHSTGPRGRWETSQEDTAASLALSVT